MMNRRVRMAAWLLDFTAAGLGLAFLFLAGHGMWMAVKAFLADGLIAHAFAAHVRDGGEHLPWSWADVHPVASLEVPRLAIQRHVLSGASGSSLAFGIGHVDGTAPPNGPGNCVLAGHRDTRFAFLAEVRVGDEVILTTRDGKRIWVVERLGVVDQAQIEFVEATTSSLLTLITCYPFDSLGRGTQRFVVWCRPRVAPEVGAAFLLMRSITTSLAPFRASLDDAFSPETAEIELDLYPGRALWMPSTDVGPTTAAVGPEWTVAPTPFPSLECSAWAVSSVG